MIDDTISFADKKKPQNKLYLCRKVMNVPSLGKCKQFKVFLYGPYPEFPLTVCRYENNVNWEFEKDVEPSRPNYYIEYWIEREATPDEEKSLLAFMRDE